MTNLAEVHRPNGERNRGLLIEADEPYSAVIAACMRLAGCKVEQMSKVEQALVVWGADKEDAVRRMEMLGELRLRSEAPLIVLDSGAETAQADLEAGADQWLPKPFVPGALVGSVRASMRKSTSPAMRLASRVEIRGMVLDGGRRRLAFRGSEVFFTRQEWDLLSILISHPERFLAAREILRLGWTAGEHAAEQLRTYAHRLRLKLTPMDLPCRLLSQHGQGYCLTFR
jgi:DNA-binding response OmpR family regulator